MIKRPRHKNDNGFTLIETIIYIGLFALIFTGIFISIYPILTGAERLTRSVTAEGELAFVLSKIDYALSSTMTDNNGAITTPGGNQLVLSYRGIEKFRFTGNSSSTYCVAPLICNVITLEKDRSGDGVPLNTQRVSFENFNVTQTAPSGGAPRFIDISFTVNGKPVGPIRYYVHF